MKSLCLLMLFILVAHPLSRALTTEKVAEGLPGIIWGFEFVESKKVLLSLREGKVFLVDLGSKIKKEIEGGPKVTPGGQGGLLDLALHPDFESNKRVYFSFTYSQDGENKTTALAVAELDEKNLRFNGLKTLFIAQPFYSTSHHFGSRISFDSEGHIFLTVGDRGHRDYAQDLGRHNGKVLRLTQTGKAAPGNPFEKTKGARPEIWSYGHRNPQGMVYDKLTGQLWTHEHGPQGGDEVNLILPGKNYGWPIITYGKEYSGGTIGGGITKKAGMQQPRHYYVPSIAPSGMALKGPEFYIGALKLTHLNQLSLTKGAGGMKETARHFESLRERIRDVKLGPDRKIYFSTDSGSIYAAQ